MPEFYILITNPIDVSVAGAHSGYSLRHLREDESISLEDLLFEKNIKIDLPSKQGVIVLPDVAYSVESVRDHLALCEFALGILAITGRISSHITASFLHGKCIDAQIIANPVNGDQEMTFPSGITPTTTSQWLRLCSDAAKKAGKAFTITAQRYSRYLKSDDPFDASLDLSIALESLLGAQTEVSFRFSVCLAKFAAKNGANGQHSYDLLKKLYELRSKIAHGDPDAGKVLKKLEENNGIIQLRQISRIIFTSYVMYLQDHSKKEWSDMLTQQLIG